MKTSPSKGFTVLELLIVIAIMCILIVLVLNGLNAARANSNDQRAVSNVQNVALGLADYFNICRQYPATLNPTEACPDLAAQGKTLADIIPTAAQFDFNATGSVYHYASLVPASTPNDTACTNYHLWVELGSTGGSYSAQRSGVSLPYQYDVNQSTGVGIPLSICPGSASQGLTGPITPQIFDIFK